MELQGELIVIGQTETIGAKGFKKRLSVIKTDEQYPQTIPVEFTQDKTNLLDNFQIGDIVKVGINLRGTEWQGRYFANIQGWKIDKGEREKSANTFMPDRQSIDAMMDNAEQIQEEENDLPF
jgi:spore germination protein YaaH